MLGVSTKRPITIGVAGGSGSGKTTVSNALIQKIGPQYVTYIAHDSYYRDVEHVPLTSGNMLNFDHPDSLETSLMVQHLQQLQRGEAVDIPTYDFSTYRRNAETIHVNPLPVLLIEGILLFVEPTLRALCDVRVFVDIDADLRFIRRVSRDIQERGRTVESVIHQYLESVRPMHLEFVEPSKRYADVIVPEGGFNAVAVELIANHVINLMAINGVRPNS